MAEKEEAKSDPEAAAEARTAKIDLVAAIILGVATVLAAFAAYQSSLWGGNCLTAYTQGTNKLGEANREMLRAVQEQSFDAVVWIENMKAREAARAAEAAAEHAGGAAAAVDDDDDDDPNLSPDQRAQEIVQELDYKDDLTLPQKLAKLQKLRTNLSDATAWANKRYSKRMAAMSPQDKLDLAKRILGHEKELEDIEKKQVDLLAKLGVTEDSAFDEDVISAALAKDEKAKAELAGLEGKWLETQASIDHEYEKLAKPLFFESPDYVRKQEAAHKKLLDEGTKLIQDGQQFNATGDKFTLLTVFFTVTLFFAGLGSVLKRQPLKLAFLGGGVLVLVYALVQLLRVPFA